MTSLKQILIRQIQVSGPMTIATYMERCLTDPQHGYYTTRDPLGATGDFTTAPEISQMFGELIGLWMADRWQQMGSPSPIILAELGPGRGTLMADALRACKNVPGFLKAITVHFVESSPTLRAVQARKFDAVWHSSISGLPEGPLLLIANEFLDALGIRQFQRLAEGWGERCVAVDDGQLVIETRTMEGSPKGPRPELLTKSSVGEIVEYCPALAMIASEIAERLARWGGAALFIDYGYSRDSTGDSFQAVKNHAFADPLETPGNADLTAHVNFNDVARAALAAGIQTLGPVSQASFLHSLGIEARAEQLKTKASDEQKKAIEAAIRRLTGSDEMGRLFKVMALLAPGLESAPGFSSPPGAPDASP